MNTKTPKPLTPAQKKKILIPCKEAGIVIGIGTGRVRQLILAGQLKGQKPGMEWLVTLYDAEKFSQVSRPRGVSIDQRKDPI